MSTNTLPSVPTLQVDEQSGRASIPSASPELLTQVGVNTSNNVTSTQHVTPVLGLSYNVGTQSDDNVITPEEKMKYEEALQKQGKSTTTPFWLKKYETESVKNWDKFYKRNTTKFYKDRHYLSREFKDLSDMLAGKPPSMIRSNIEQGDSDNENEGEGEASTNKKASSTTSESSVSSSTSTATPPVSSSSSSSSQSAPSTAPSSTPTPAAKTPILPTPDNPFIPPAFVGPVANQKVLLEVGCGVGNALFPLSAEHPSIFFFGVDCSKNAIAQVFQHNNFDVNKHYAYTMDLVKDAWPSQLQQSIGIDTTEVVSTNAAGVEEKTLSEYQKPMDLRGGVDFATLIFVLSAIHPDEMLNVLKKVHAIIKPGGTLFLRDYARYDLAQFRFAKSSKLGDNWYVRQDGTRSYFFSTNEMVELLTSVGFNIVECQLVKKVVVNRKEQNQMNRRFIQIRAKATGIFENGKDLTTEDNSNITSTTN